MLYEKFGIMKNDVVSIVGCNGKTTLLWTLAKELSGFKVLASTSAKIALPDNIAYNFFYGSVDSFEADRPAIKNGISVISGGYIPQKRKLTGLSDQEIMKLIPFFEYVVLEADGSRGLPLKGWKKHEPPVSIHTSKTIAILPSGVLNKRIDEDLVYGLDEFRDIVGDADVMTLGVLAKIINDKNGIFKNSRGEKIFILNVFDGDGSYFEKSIVDLAELVSPDIKLFALNLKSYAEDVGL